jgi:hypothetical protein
LLEQQQVVHLQISQEELVMKPSAFRQWCKLV